MDDEISIPMTIPLDGDGFIRRECPTCEREFKWFSHSEGDPDAEPANQYFCPLCGVAAGVNEWWTQAQLAHAQGVVGPEMDRLFQDAIGDAFKGNKGIDFKPNRDFTLGIETPEPLFEPDDMVIVEPPCHPNEPIKVPEEATGQVHCLVCGATFAA